MLAAEVVTLAQVLPGVVLKEHSHWTSITYRGKGFAWVNHEDDTAMVKSTHADRAVLVGSDPATFSEGWESRSTAWVSIRLIPLLTLTCAEKPPSASIAASTPFTVTRTPGRSSSVTRPVTVSIAPSDVVPRSGVSTSSVGGSPGSPPPADEHATNEHTQR